MASTDQIYAFTNTSEEISGYIPLAATFPMNNAYRNHSIFANAKKVHSSKVVAEVSNIDAESDRITSSLTKALTTALSLIAFGSVATAETSYTLQKSVITQANVYPRVAQSLPVQFEEAWFDMEMNRDLKDGWDGQGSIAPSNERIETALTFLKLLPNYLRSPEAMVSSDGTTGWFWRTEKIYASIEFLSNNKLTYFARTNDKSLVSHGVIFYDKKSIPSDLLGILRMA